MSGEEDIVALMTNRRISRTEYIHDGRARPHGLKSGKMNTNETTRMSKTEMNKQNIQRDPNKLGINNDEKMATDKIAGEKF